MEFLRIFEEFDNFLELFLGFVAASDILKGGFLLLGRQKACAGLAKTESLVAAGLHLAHQEENEACKEKEWESVEEDQDPITAADFLDVELNGFVAESLGDFGRVFLGDGDTELAVGRASVFSLELVAVRREIERDFLDVALIDLGHEFAVAGAVLASGLAVAGHQPPEHDAQEDNGDPEEDRFGGRTGIHSNLTIYPYNKLLKSAALVSNAAPNFFR